MLWVKMSVDNLGEDETRMKWMVTSIALRTYTEKNNDVGKKEAQKHLVTYRYLIRTSPPDNDSDCLLLSTFLMEEFLYLCRSAPDQSPDIGPQSSILPVSYVFRRRSSCVPSLQVSIQQGTAWPADNF